MHTTMSAARHKNPHRKSRNSILRSSGFRLQSGSLILPLQLETLTSNQYSYSTTQVLPSTNLTAPFGPAQDPGVRTDIVWHPGDQFIGGQLIYSLLYEAYDYWKLPELVMIHPFQHRYKAFPSIVQIVIPSTDLPGTTPSRIGLAVLSILHQVLALPKWPGPFSAQARQLPSTELYFAYLSVLRDNPPVIGGKLTATMGNATSFIESSISNNTDGLVVYSGIPPFTTLSKPSLSTLNDKDWLDAYSAMLAHAFTYTHDTPVSSDVRPYAPMRYRSKSGKVVAILIVTTQENPFFLWTHLVEGLLVDLAEWAEMDVWRPMDEGRIVHNGVVVTTFGVKPTTRVGDEGLETEKE